MNVLINTSTPENGLLSLRVMLDVKINVSDEQARRNVSRFVAMEISTNIGGREPMLVLASRPCWRVPVHLTLPGLGDLGSLGHVDVDTETGEFLVSKESIIQEIKNSAAHLASRFAPKASDGQSNVSDVEAQRRVTRFAHGEISSQMHGGIPKLILGDAVIWSVPVHLTFPSVGDAGVVGYIEVDVKTGELNTSLEVIGEIESHAENLATLKFDGKCAVLSAK